MKLTLDQLNETHREWMALDVNASPNEKQKVFEMMKRHPKGYLSGSHENGFGIIMNGLPVTAYKLPLAAAIQKANALGVQTRFAWSAPKWIEIEQTTNL